MCAKLLKLISLYARLLNLVNCPAQEFLFFDCGFVQRRAIFRLWLYAALAIIGVNHVTVIAALTKKNFIP